MRILVTGAGGFIGSHLVRGLREAGHDVVCCGRNERRLQRLFPDCSVVGVDYSCERTPEQWRPIFKKVDVVVNAVGIIQERGDSTFAKIHREEPIALFCAAHQDGVKRVVQLSALGADEQAATAYHLSKKAADDFLAELPLEWVILRPSIVYGPGARSQEFFAALAALPLIPLAGGGEQRIQPVSVIDLTAAVLRLVQADAPSRLRLDVVGPEPITFKMYLQSLRVWLELPPARTVSIPLQLVRAAAILGNVCRWEFLNSSTVSMLCRENVGDPGPFTHATGISPRSHTDVFQTWPSRSADRWHAGLFFLRPLLRFSIAAVWIAAGFLSLAVYPQEASLALLAKAGIAGWIALPVLIGTSVLDLVLGCAMLFKWMLPLVLFVQSVLIVVFSTIIALALPEFWLHPFGPLVKNGPLLVGTLILLVLERKS